MLFARQRDARFFWEADLRARLDTLRFHAKLGGYLDKARRIERNWPPPSSATLSLPCAGRPCPPASPAPPRPRCTEGDGGHQQAHGVFGDSRRPAGADRADGPPRPGRLVTAAKKAHGAVPTAAHGAVSDEARGAATKEAGGAAAEQAHGADAEAGARPCRTIRRAGGRRRWRPNSTSRRRRHGLPRPRSPRPPPSTLPSTAFTEAAAFDPAVDRFFTDVLVMAGNPDLRRRRLVLLKRLDRLVLQASRSVRAGCEGAAFPCGPPHSPSVSGEQENS